MWGFTSFVEMRFSCRKWEERSRLDFSLALIWRGVWSHLSVAIEFFGYKLQVYTWLPGLLFPPSYRCLPDHSTSSNAILVSILSSEPDYSSHSIDFQASSKSVSEAPP
jgi:hypothetical protein